MQSRRLSFVVITVLTALIVSGCSVSIFLPPLPKVRLIYVEQYDVIDDLFVSAFVKNHSSKPQRFYVEFWGEFDGPQLAVKTEPRMIAPGEVIHIEESYNKLEYPFAITEVILWVEWANQGFTTAHVYRF